MKKIQYIAPALQVTRLSVERMVAVSGPGTSDKSADPNAGMDTKASRSDYNVWNDDWSR